MKRKVELKAERDQALDQLNASTELLQIREAQLAEELRRRAELEQELRLNASMLARQCDLAREAEMECARDNKALKTVEAERDESIQEKHRAWASLDHAIEENRRVERERDGLKQELEACQAACAVMRAALGKAHHELTVLHGCYANDAPYAEGPDMANAWQIDTGVITNVIDRVLATTAGTAIHRELEVLREIAQMAIDYEELLINDFEAKYGVFNGEISLAAKVREAMNKMRGVQIE